MNIQTRGEFESSVKFCPSNGVFAFIKYKGEWVESIVKNDGYSVKYYYFGSTTSVYLSECIIKVYKPEPPNL